MINSLSAEPPRNRFRSLLSDRRVGVKIGAIVGVLLASLAVTSLASVSMMSRLNKGEATVYTSVVADRELLQTQTALGESTVAILRASLTYSPAKSTALVELAKTKLAAAKTAIAPYAAAADPGLDTQLVQSWSEDMTSYDALFNLSSFRLGWLPEVHPPRNSRACSKRGGCLRWRSYQTT